MNVAPPSNRARSEEPSPLVGPPPVGGKTAGSAVGVAVFMGVWVAAAAVGVTVAVAVAVGVAVFVAVAVTVGTAVAVASIVVVAVGGVAEVQAQLPNARITSRTLTDPGPPDYPNPPARSR